jgi:serine O-acetyltransferase
MKQSISQTISLIKSDFIKRCEYENKTFNFVQGVKLCFYPAAVGVMLFRLQAFFFQHNLNLFASIIKVINTVLFSIAIDSSAIIGERFMILHASFITIGPNVTIGTDFMAVHHNGIMASPFFTEHQSAQGPTIGNHVVLGGGGMITGAITIGDDVKVSMNASVEADFENGAVLFGVPARNVNQQKSEEAAT